MGMALWALLLVPGLSQALGLGEIEVNSALNQPLNAEIELISVRPGEMQDLQVRVAPEALYRRLGIERSAIITELRFAPTTLPDGRHVVRVTTSNPVREPFVNFLVEATWPAGRLVREYTLLLDPPVLFEQRAEPAPRAPVTEAPREARPAPVAPAAPRPAAPAPRATLDTYRVQRGDMLWNVARDLRPDASVSIEQMMLALLRANPEAFTDNNINNLQSGRVLRVPDMAEISRLNQADARTEVARQNALWQEYRTRLAAAPQPQIPAQPVAEAPAVPRAEVVPTPAEQDARLEILAARDTDEARAEVERELALARETAETRGREAEELRSRVAELESLLSRSERLLELNNAQMAELQARLDELEGREPAEPAEVAEAPAVVAPEEPPVVAEAEPAPAPVEPAVEAEPVVPDEAVTLSEAERMAETAEAPAVEVAPAPEVAVAPAPAPAPAAPVQPRPASLVDEIMASPNLMMIAGLVLLLVLLLIWLMIKRLGKGKRAAAASGMASPAGGRTEPALSGGEGALAAAAAGGAMAGAAALAADHAEAEGQEAELSETEEMTAAGAEEAESPAAGVESEEIINDDTIAEVDVYLAYGLYSQAEDLLNKAVQEHPERVDYRFKLAETHYANRNVEAFEANAQAMHDTLAGRPSQLWERVQSMGQELNPANPLFSGAAAMDFAASGEAASTEVDLDLGVQDLEGSLEDLDLGEEPVAEPEPLEAEAAAEVDLGIEEKTTASADEALEFDLGDLDLGGEDLETELIDTTAEAEAEMTAPVKPLDVSAELEESLEIGALDEDLGAGLDEELAASFDLEGETTAAERPVGIDTAEDDTQIMEEDFSEIDFLGEGAEGEELLVTDEEEQALPSGDEVSTKLDLARAYIDMGDSEGARSTLEEVLSEGNPSQKQEAQGLLDQLS